MAAAAARVGLLYDERMCAQAMPDGEDHPENPERLRPIWRKLKAEGITSRCVVLKAKKAKDKHIASVHSQNHIKLMKKISSKKYNSSRNKIARKFSSIYFNKGSSESALLAAGSVIEVAEKVAAGELTSAIALVRPPGHHAEHDKAMGFCLFNNVGVAANYLLNERPDLGIKKILIVDWDVHHGNGTQKLFYDDPRVLFFSVHRFDNRSFYPAEPDASHHFIGEESGRGYNINVPWEQGECGDADYIAAWDHVLLPVTEAFDPDMILVSAGFDAALGDPLGGCCITPNGYALLLTKLLGFAQGRIVMALEGGYNLISTANSVFACAKVLLGDKFTFNSPGMQPFLSTWRVIEKVRNELKTCWPVLSNKLPEVVSWIRSSSSEVHFPSDASVPATLERSPICFNECIPTAWTCRQRGQRAMKAIHRQMTLEDRAETEDEKLAEAEATATQRFLDIDFGSDSSDSDYTPPTPPVRVSHDAKAGGSGTVQSGPTVATSLATTTAAAGPSDIQLAIMKLNQEHMKRCMCCFDARDDQYLARAIDDFETVQQNSGTGQDQLSSPSPSRCSQFAIDAQLTGDSPVKAAIEEEDVDAQLTGDSPVEATIEEDVDVSPSHIPSRKRPRSLRKDQLARLEVPQVAEPAPAQAVEAAVEEAEVTIEILEWLPQLAEGSHAMKAWKSLTTRAKRANFYEQARSARDGRFWSTEQEDMYNSFYRTKRFADNRWIDWENINHSKEIQYVEEKCLHIGLHKLMGTRQDYHEETIRQFFSTVYINPSRTSMMWMSGINRKITVTKRFCENVLLDHPVHSSKIKDSLTDIEEKELDSCISDDGHFNAANRLVRKTIYPRAGDKNEVHNDKKVILIIFCSGSLSTL